MDKKIEDRSPNKFNRQKSDYIINSISSENINNVIITGGHFRIFFNKSGFKEEINIGTIKSFEFAIKMYLALKKKGINTKLGLLINDMGSTCDEENCNCEKLKFSREKYCIPKIYTTMLTGLGFGLDSCSDKKDIVKIFWEKNVRNRAKKEFLKVLKKSNRNIEIIKKNSIGYFIEDKNLYGKIILTRIVGKDKYGTPACPLIMAGFNIMQERQGFSKSINFYYIGQDNTSNISNYFVIEKGKRVNKLLGCSINVENIYFNKY